MSVLNYVYGRLIGVMVSVLTIGPKVRGLKPGRGDGILRAIKILSTHSFGGEVKPYTPCRKILLHVKNHLGSVNKNTSQGQINVIRPFLLLYY
jgi:hypothetical protein